MAWVVIGEEKGRIKLVSKKPTDNELPGLLPKGSYLTIDSQETGAKFILRVDDSQQYAPFAPSPLIIDMDLSGLYEDTKCQNIIYAERTRDLATRSDGKIDFIPPQAIARRSTQTEIDLALGQKKGGAKVFLATVHGGQNQLLFDVDGKFVTASLPNDMFYHQMIVCGATGSGKTVAMKYLAQHFVEELEGAVLAVNVKERDLLTMNQKSTISDLHVRKEWGVLGIEPHGVSSTVIYYPANTSVTSYKGVTKGICEKITLDVNEIDAESLIGLLANVSEIAAQSLPDIFRYWKETVKQKNDRFNDFVTYFINGESNQRTFQTLNIRGDQSMIQLHAGTYQNVLRNLNSAVVFFDNPNARTLSADDILQKGKLSVIDVVGSYQFGSVVLRHLLKRIVEAKDQQNSSIPILIVIDEVHQFYNSEDARQALGHLDTICRTGRSKKIGIIFASQNASDIPKGLSGVVNSKVYFKSSEFSSLKFSGLTGEEIASLGKGFAVVNIHEMPQVRIVKFPLSLAGVSEEEE